MPIVVSLFVWTEQGVHEVINTGKHAGVAPTLRRTVHVIVPRQGD